MKDRLNNFVKWVLFLVAYYPLFLILLIQNSKLIDKIFKLDLAGFKWSEFNDPIIYGLVVGLVIWIIIKSFVKFQQNTNTIQYKIVDIKNISHETLNYILTYLIAFLSLNLENPKTILCVMILLFIIGIIYINSNLLYINPILQLLDYSIYELTVTREGCNEVKIIAISKISQNKIRKHEFIDISLVNEGSKNIYFVK